MLAEAEGAGIDRRLGDGAVVDRRGVVGVESAVVADS
jgi:hypothetical protein